MAQYSIKDVELLSGVKAHTLRIWEQRYDFLKPNRTETNIRYYNDEQLKNILNVSLLNRQGMRISKIAELDKEQIAAIILKIAEEQHQPDVLLDALIYAMVEFDEHRFEKTLSTAIMRMGFQRTFSELVFPFLIRTGLLWATGAIRSAQEHFISNLIRRKISVAIDNQYVERNAQSKKFFLFLPEGETHEFLLLFTEYLLRQHHHEVVYIGSSLLLEDIEFVEKSFQPDYFLTYFTLPLPEFTVQEYIQQIVSAFPDIKMIVGGVQLSLQNPHLPPNVTAIHSLEELEGTIH